MLYKAFHVAGVINVTTLDGGLVSLVEVPVHVDAVIINTDAHEGNIIEAWIGNSLVLEIYDYNLDTQELAAADTPPLSSVKMGRIPVNHDIQAGQVFKIGIRCGAVASDIYGSYEYNETGG